MREKKADKAPVECLLRLIHGAVCFKEEEVLRSPEKWRNVRQPRQLEAQQGMDRRRQDGPL